MDGILASAGAAEGATKDGGDRRGESCQSQTENPDKTSGFFYLTSRGDRRGESCLFQIKSKNNFLDFITF